MSATTKNSAAQELGRKRWSGVSAEARSSHAKMAVNAREEKRARERAVAKARIPDSLEILLAKAARDDLYKPSAYYELGYRLGVTQLSEASRNRLIRTLARRRRELLYIGHLRSWRGIAVESTLSAMPGAQVERLELDLAKLTSWDDRRASTSLRAILRDPAIVAAIPRSRHHQFLAGLRAGAAGEAMRYHRPRFHFQSSSAG